MGTPRTAADWSVRAFPTYYVIDADGRIQASQQQCDREQNPCGPHLSTPRPSPQARVCQLAGPQVGTGIWHIFDKNGVKIAVVEGDAGYDPDLDVSSMARTTGYTATMTLRLLADCRFRRPGICPPEYLGQVPGCVDHLLAGLAARGVVYRETVEVL